MKKHDPIQTLVSRVADRLSPFGGANSFVREQKSRPLVLEALEPRILFSGSPAPAPAPAPSEAPAAQEAPPPAPAPTAEAEAEVAPPEEATQASGEVAVPIPADVSAEDPDPASSEGGDTAIVLTDPQLSALTNAASQIWEASGISADQSAALASASYQIADLSDISENALGSVEGNIITIDDDAAGRGWFVDSTPEENGSFALSGADANSAGTGVDLLTAILHEQGHILGLDDHAAGEGDVMLETLGFGERRLPEAGVAEAASPGSLEGIHNLTFDPTGPEDFEDEASESTSFTDNIVGGGPEFTLVTDQTFEIFDFAANADSGTQFIDTYGDGNPVSGEIGTIQIESGWSFEVRSIGVALSDQVISGAIGGMETVTFTGVEVGTGTEFTHAPSVDSSSGYTTVDFTGTDLEDVQLEELKVSLPSSPAVSYIFLDDFEYIADDSVITPPPPPPPTPGVTLKAFYDFEGTGDDRFDDPAGDFADNLVGQFNAAFSVDTPSVITGTQSASFDGNSALFTDAFTTDLGPDPDEMTIMFWVKGEDILQENNNTRLLTSRVKPDGSATDGRSWQVEGFGNDGTRGDLMDVRYQPTNGVYPANWFSPDATDALARQDQGETAEWRHVAFVLSNSGHPTDGGAYGETFVDGVSVGVSNPDTLWDDHTLANLEGQLIIGGNSENAGSRAFTGLLDDVALFGGIVSDADIAAIAAGTLSPGDFLITPATPLEATPGSFDRIVGEGQSAVTLGYFTDANSNVTGVSGSSSSNTRQHSNVVVGFDLPTLPAGHIIDSATLTYKIVGGREQSGSIPDLHTYLLDDGDPSDSGTDFFFEAATDPNPLTEFVGSVTEAEADSAGNGDFSSAQETLDYDASHMLSTDALAMLQSFYSEETPDQTEAFFRWNLAGDGDLGTLNRYNVDLTVVTPLLTINTSPAPPVTLDAVDDDYTASNPINEDETLTIAAPGVLANDTGGGGGSGGPIIYEGFQYGPAAADASEWESDNQVVFPFHGEPDGSPEDTDATGLAGTWINDNNGDGDNLFLKQDSLAFGDLSTSGNHIGFRPTHLDSDIFHRDLTAEAQSAVGGASEIWISILADKTRNRNGAAEGGIVFSNQAVGQDAKILLNDGSDGLEGFGIAPLTDGRSWTTYGWDGSTQIAGTAGVNTDINVGDVHLLVGKISFDTGAGGSDEFTLYDYNLTSSGGSVVADLSHLNEIEMIEVDVDQSTLDTINITRANATNYDELRIGSTLEDVLGLASGGGGIEIIASDTTSANGAVVTVNSDGSFTYDPTGSATIQALNNGQSVTDTFTYTITDPSSLGSGPASLATGATVEISDNAAGFDISVFPGKAGYEGSAGNTGMFGDGTVLDYRFFDSSGTTFNGTGYANGGGGIVGTATATNSSGINGGALNWADVWTTGDPDSDPANFTNDTVARSQGITGSVDISGLVSGSVDFIYGSFTNPNTITLTMTGAGQPDIIATHTEDPPGTNKGWTTNFTFEDAALYDTITYTYTNTDTDGSRARFMGVVVDGVASPTDSATVSVLVNGVTDVAPPAIDSNPGDISIFTESGGTDSITSSDFNNDFDTTVRESPSHTLTEDSDGIELAAGHHLVVYNAQFEKGTFSGNENRSEIQSNLNLDGNDQAIGWSQGYIRELSGQNQTITAGGGIIHVENDGEVLQLQSFRTDVDTNPTTRSADGTGIQLIKLDDSWDYLSLEGHDGSGTDQTIPNSTANFTAVQYGSSLELDGAAFAHDTATNAEDITLTASGHYLVFANTYTQGASSRTAIIQQLSLGDGTTQSKIEGTESTVYLRGNDINQLTDEGAVTIGTIIEASAGDILNVEITQDVGRGGMTIDGDRTGITIVKLPDDSDYLSLIDTSGDQNLNSSTALNYDDPTSQIEVDPSFSHSTTSNPSQVTVNSGGDYLFLTSAFDSDDGAARGYYNQQWNVNGAPPVNYGQTGQYTRNTGGADQFGNWSGAVFELNEGDYVESTTQPLGAGGTNNADTLALQAVNLTQLFAPRGAIDDTASTTEDVVLDVTDPASGLLANDEVNGNVITSDTISDLGASVFVNPDGTFTYDPTASTVLQSLPLGGSVADTFTYGRGAPEATSGADFHVDASQDTDGDSRWEDLAGVSGFDFELAGSVTRVTGVSDLAGIDAAYDFVGGSTGNAGGALLSDADSSTRRSFQNASGDWTDNENVTIELWFKPDNLSPTPANGQILFEDGGGRGLGLFIDDGNLEYRRANLNAEISTDITGLADEFIQAVATYDIGTGAMELFVNGVSVGTSSSGGDWSGGDAVGLGTRGAANTGGIGGGQSNTESFDGQIAMMRVYRNQILTASEVENNYGSVAYETTEATGLQGYWKLDSIVATDSSGNGRDGTFTGNLADGNPVAGQVDGAIDFDTTTDFVEIQGYKGVTGSDPRSMSAWILFEGSDPDQGIMSWGSDNPGEKWTFRAQDSNGQDGAIRVEVNGSYIVGSTDIRDGQWHMVTAVFDPGSVSTGAEVEDIRLYVDGQLETTSAILNGTINTAVGNDVRIGLDEGTRDWEGLIDEAAIWDRVLSDAEIADLYSFGQHNEAFENIATVTVTVTGENDAPTANSDQLTVGENAPGSGNVLTNDTDIDGATPGMTLNFEASADTDGAAWEDTAGVVANYNFDSLSGTEPALVEVTSDRAQITNAYQFTGGEIGGDGAFELHQGTGTVSLQDLPGNASDASGTFELWFKPGELPLPDAGSPNVRQILWEDGGGTGIGLFVEGTELVLTKLPGTGEIRYDISGISDDFIQAAWTFNRSPNPDVLQLYVNGELVGTDPTANNGNDFSGGDGAAIGGRGENNVGGQGGGDSSSESFQGQIAVFRFYESILNASEVQRNYVAVANGVPPVAIPEVKTLTSGAIVTISGDGNFTYDPNGAFEDLAAGESATDTFEYTLVDGESNQVTLTLSEFTTAAQNDNVGDDSPAESGAFAGADLYVRDRANENDPQLEVEAFLKFDLSGVTGPVTGATLNLHQFDKLNNANSANLNIARVLDAWDATGATDPGHSEGGSPTSVADEFSFGNNGAANAGPAVDIDHSIDITDWVNGWLEDPASNHGVRLRIDADFVGAAFDSTGANAPSLVLDVPLSNDVGTVTVTINGANDTPVATDDNVTTDEDTAIQGNVITVDSGEGLDSDVDTRDVLYVESIDTSNTMGQVTMALPKVIGEVGNFATDSLDDSTNPTQVLNNTYVDPVVLATPPTENGGDSSVVRITNVSTTSFSATLAEAPDHNPGHTAETVDFAVFESGQYTLSDGTKIMIGTVDATGNAWETVNFGGFFTSTPAVMTQIQSHNDPVNTFVKTRQDNTSATSFDVKLERAEGDGNHGTETIGFIAIEQASGTVGGLIYEAATSGETIDETYDPVTFGLDFGAAPNLVASLATFTGGDPTGLRYRNLDGTGVQFLAEEDTNNDSETGHSNEAVSYLALGGDGDIIGFDAGAIPSVTPGATLNFDASLDTDGNSVWESTANTSRDWNLGANVTRETSLTGAPLGISAAYDFPQTGQNNAAFEGNAPDYENFNENQDATWEFWIQADNLTAGQTVWEVGGATDGAGLVMTPSGEILFVVNDSGASAAVSTAFPTDGGFHQILVTYDRDDPNETPTSTDSLKLYIDGVLASTDASQTALHDWSGTDDSGLGGKNGTTGGHNGAGGAINFDSFDGKIAIVRFYENKALTGAEVQNNYDAVSTGGNGTFTYDPNGQFDYLNPGETATDTFTYTLGNGPISGTLKEGLEGYWQFEGGTASDRSGNGRDGTLSGDATAGTGQVGNAVVLDGIDDYVDFGDVDLFEGGDFTFSSWFRRDVDNAGGANATNHNVNNVILGQSSNSANDNFEIGSEGNNLEIYVDSGGGSEDGTVTVAVPGGIANGSWNHVALSYDSSDLFVYFNGALISTIPNYQGPLDGSASSELTAGLARPDNQLWGDLEGAVDEMAIWSRALSATEVGEVFAAGQAGDSFVTNEATVTVTISGLNDAPVLVSTNDFDGVTVSNTENDGNTVADLIGSITDADANSVEGIAVTTATVNGSGAIFEFSTDGGSNWDAVGTVSETGALLLRSSDLIRFSPDGSADVDGLIEFKAWDQTGATAGMEGDKMTTLPDGGTSAFSTGIGTSTVTTVNASIEDGTLLYGEAEGRHDRVQIYTDGTNLIIHDDAGPVTASADGTQIDANTISIPLIAFDDLDFRANDFDDIIEVGSLDGFDGSIKIDGEEGSDVVQTFRTTATLADDESVDFDAEEVMLILSEITVGGAGSIDLDATTNANSGSGGAGMTYNGLWLYGSDLEATGTGTITLAGEGGDTGTNNNGIKLTNGSEVTTADGDIDIDGTGGGDALFGTGVALHHSSSVSAGGGGNLTIDGTGGTGTGLGEGVFFGAGTGATVADGDLTITGTATGDGSQNQGVDFTGATLEATGTGAITVTGSGSGSGTNNIGLSTTATDIATTTGTVTLTGTGGTGTSNNQGVRLASTDVTTAGGSIDIDGRGNGTGSGVYNTGVQLAGTTLEVAAGAGTIDIDGTAGDGTALNDGVQITAGSAVTTETGAIGIRGTGMGAFTGNRGANLIASTVGSTSGDITILGTGSETSTAVLNDGVSLSNSHATTAGTLKIAGTGGTGSLLNNGVKVVGGSLSGVLDIDGTGGGDPATGSSNAGVYILNSDLSGALGGSAVDGTGGFGGGLNLGAYLQGTMWGALTPDDVTTDPNEEDEKAGNFFSTILPLALMAGAERNSRRTRQDEENESVLRDLLKEICGNGSMDLDSDEVAIYRSIDGVISLEPKLANRRDLAEAGCSIPVATEGSRHTLVITGDDDDFFAGLLVSFSAEDEMSHEWRPLRSGKETVEETTVGEFLSAVETQTWSRSQAESKSGVDSRHAFSEAFGLDA